jgi:MFS family permease
VSTITPAPSSPPFFQRIQLSEKWLVLLLLWWDYFIIYIHRNDIFFVFPLLEKDLEFSEFELGMVGAIFQWTYSLVSPFVGYLGDRFRRRTILVWGALLSTVLTAFIGMAQSSAQVILLRTLLAISQAASVPAAAGLIADYHGPRTRSTAMGIYLTSPFAGLLTSGVLGGYLAQHFGWRRSFWTFAILGLLMTVALYMLLKEPVRDLHPGKPALPSPARQDLWRVIRELFSTKTWLAVATVFTLDGVVRSTITTWLPFFFYEKFSLSLSQAGSLSTKYIQSASMLGVLCGGRAGDWGAQKSVRGRIFVQTVGLTAMIPALYLMGFSSSMTVLSAAMLCYGFGVGLNQANTWPTAFQVIAPSSRSTAVGMLNFVGGITAGWLPAAAGSLKSTVGLDVIIGMMSLLSLMSSLVYVGTMIWFLPKEAARYKSGPSGNR